MTTYRHPYSVHRSKEETPKPSLLPNSALIKPEKAKKVKKDFVIVPGVASVPIVTNRLGPDTSLYKMEGGTHGPMRAYEKRSSHDPARRQILHVKCLLAAFWGYLSQGIHSHKLNLGTKMEGGGCFLKDMLYLSSCAPRLCGVLGLRLALYTISRCQK